AEGGQPTDELLAELEGVRLVVEERGPERRAEPEEEDETGDHPDLASAERGADRLTRLEKRRLVRPRAWLARERQAHAERHQRKAGREEEGHAQAARLRHLAADLAHQHGRQGDACPLSGLESAGEAARATVLDHH